MEHTRLERITAYAALSDARAEIGQIAEWAARGDADWQLWLDAWRAGRALMLRLDLVAEIGGADGVLGRARCSAQPVWVEREADPPRVQEQLRELAANHFGELARALREAGLQIADADLDEMYVEVRLDRSLRAALVTAAVGDVTGPGVSDPER